jgi:hypothetical protein
MSPLAGWESFYVIVGSSAAALTGLQFVVIALVAQVRRQSSVGEIDAFGTPTIVHFCAVLLLAAILSAPWEGLSRAGLLLAVTGLAGLVYCGVVTRRARRQTGYRPVFVDWLWHIALPVVSYAALFIAGARLASHSTEALFTIAATALLLLFIGIHNAWDTVIYIAVTRSQEPIEREPTVDTPEGER